MAATVPTDEGEDSPLLHAALSIGQPADDSSDTDKPTPAPRGEPPTGSYEKFLATFGRSVA